jgi:hypothetical protein
MAGIYTSYGDKIGYLPRLYNIPPYINTAPHLSTNAGQASCVSLRPLIRRRKVAGIGLFIIRFPVGDEGPDIPGFLYTTIF